MNISVMMPDVVMVLKKILTGFSMDVCVQKVSNFDAFDPFSVISVRCVPDCCNDFGKHYVV